MDSVTKKVFDAFPGEWTEADACAIVVESATALSPTAIVRAITRGSG